MLLYIAIKIFDLKYYCTFLCKLLPTQNNIRNSSTLFYFANAAKAHTHIAWNVQPLCLNTVSTDNDIHIKQNNRNWIKKNAFDVKTARIIKFWNIYAVWMVPTVMRTLCLDRQQVGNWCYTDASIDKIQGGGIRIYFVYKIIRNYCTVSFPQGDLNRVWLGEPDIQQVSSTQYSGDPLSAGNRIFVFNFKSVDIHSLGRSGSSIFFSEIHCSHWKKCKWNFVSNLCILCGT